MHYWATLAPNTPTVFARRRSCPCHGILDAIGDERPGHPPWGRGSSLRSFPSHSSRLCSARRSL